MRRREDECSVARSVLHKCASITLSHCIADNVREPAMATFDRQYLITDRIPSPIDWPLSSHFDADFSVNSSLRRRPTLKSIEFESDRPSLSPLPTDRNALSVLNRLQSADLETERADTISKSLNSSLISSSSRTTLLWLRL